MKVLVVSAFPPEPAPEANHALHLSEHLARAGLEVHVLCREGSVPVEQPGATVHGVMRDWSWRDVPRLEACLRDTRPDAVLLLYLGWVFNHQTMVTFLPTLCRRVLPGVPCVTQFENVDKGAPSRPLVERARRKAMAWRAGPGAHPLFGTLLRDSARIIALSSPHRAHLARHDPDVVEKCVVLPPPPLIRPCPEAPDVARRHARMALGCEREDFVWLFWGYIYPGKGVDTLMRAFELLWRRRPHVRLALVGGPLDFPAGPIGCDDYFRMVRRLPDTLGIDRRVVWTGHFGWNSDDGSRYLHGGDACVLPLDYGVTLNNSSLAAAATHALPIVATELPSGRDAMLEHGRNVLLCPPRDPAILAEAMQLVVDGADLRERLRDGVRAMARKWHRWDTMTARLIDVLQAAVSETVRPRHTGAEAPFATNCGTTPVGPGSPSARRIARERPDDAASPRARAGSGANTAADAGPPLVSVIVAVHDVEPYLSQCLDSLVNQTLTSIEIILVNDASTDGSGAIAYAYQARHENILLLDCPRNIGLASARNLGMRHARGLYVGFLDGDDWADPRKYEWMYRRAERDDSDIVFARNWQFLDDSKRFTEGNDQRIWDAVSQEMKRRPIRAVDEPRVFVIEPAVWAKLYRRGFLQQHELEFEAGMNSVEDVIFHFAALWHAKRISLLDAALTYYRLNRPGQITGRRDRRVFETIEVFDRTAQLLRTWNAPDDVWASLLSVELRFFNWLLADRVPVGLRRDFLASCSDHLRTFPDRALRAFARDGDAAQLARLACMRREWLRAYDVLAVRPRLHRVLSAALRLRRGERLRHLCRRVLQRARRRSASVVHSSTHRLLGLGKLAENLKAARHAGDSGASAPSDDEALVEVVRIDGQEFFFAAPPRKSGLADAVWRVRNDWYFSRAAVPRPGDVVIDVGAHVGVFAITLARMYPFVTVYALEPDPLNFACLTRNVALNGVDNVIAINRAISADGRPKTLYTDPWDSGWATTDARIASSRRWLRTLRVDSVAPDELLRDAANGRCRLLKMTALGAVRETLQGIGASGCVDLLCGEADLADCSRITLEAASWRIARQHFWRTLAQSGGHTRHGVLHRMPEGVEPLLYPPESTAAAPAAAGARSAE